MDSAQDNFTVARKPYVKPVARRIDSQGVEGKQLLAELQAHERRSSQRVMLQVPVQVHLSMPDGRALRQDGLTRVVNAHGCLLGIETKIEVGQRVTLLNPRSGAKQSGTVVSTKRSREGSYLIAIEFDGPVPQLWSPVLPSQDYKAGRSWTVRIGPKS